MGSFTIVPKPLLFRRNARLARSSWGDLPSSALGSLKTLTYTHSLSVAAGHLQWLDRRWYITHSGLLHIATLKRCSGITSKLIENRGDNRWVFKATVYKSKTSRGFAGYGDADPSNVSPLVRGAEMRVAETRAVNRALRKAYGIGLCSVEELGWSSKPEIDPSQQAPYLNNGRSNGFHLPKNGQPLLRDQLCVLIRQFNLDPALVKAYAADFCGTQTLKDASRDLVESFISHLSASAKEDRDGLVCKLNSFSGSAEVRP